MIAFFRLIVFTTVFGTDNINRHDINLCSLSRMTQKDCEYLPGRTADQSWNEIQDFYGEVIARDATNFPKCTDDFANNVKNNGRICDHDGRTWENNCVGYYDDYYSSDDYSWADLFILDCQTECVGHDYKKCIECEWYSCHELRTTYQIDPKEYCSTCIQGCYDGRFICHPGAVDYEKSSNYQMAQEWTPEEREQACSGYDAEKCVFCEWFSCHEMRMYHQDPKEYCSTCVQGCGDIERHNCHPGAVDYEKSTPEQMAKDTLQYHLDQKVNIFKVTYVECPGNSWDKGTHCECPIDCADTDFDIYCGCDEAKSCCDAAEAAKTGPPNLVCNDCKCNGKVLLDIDRSYPDYDSCEAICGSTPNCNYFEVNERTCGSCDEEPLDRWCRLWETCESWKNVDNLNAVYKFGEGWMPDTPTGKGCWIHTPNNCPIRSEYDTAYISDNYDNAGSSETRCLQRAAEFDTWCPTTGTIAVFNKNGCETFTKIMSGSPEVEYWVNQFRSVQLNDDKMKQVQFCGNEWYYGATPTCVGKGKSQEQCETSYFCAGKGTTYGYGKQQASAVKMAIGNDGVHPNCPQSLKSLKSVNRALKKALMSLTQ